MANVVDRIVVPFDGDGSGVDDLSWGQAENWSAIVRQKTWIPLGGVRPLGEGTTVDDIASEVSYLMGRFQSIRTRLRFDPDGRPTQVVSSSGEITVDVIDAGADDPAEVAEPHPRRVRRGRSRLHQRVAGAVGVDPAGEHADAPGHAREPLRHRRGRRRHHDDRRRHARARAGHRHAAAGTGPMAADPGRAPAERGRAALLGTRPAIGRRPPVRLPGHPGRAALLARRVQLTRDGAGGACHRGAHRPRVGLDPARHLRDGAGAADRHQPGRGAPAGQQPVPARPRRRRLHRWLRPVSARWTSSGRRSTRRWHGSRRRR